MIKLGDYNILTVVKEVDFGLYLDGGDEADHDAKDDRHEQDERQAGNDLSHGSP